MRVIAAIILVLGAAAAWGYNPNEVNVTGHEMPNELKNVKPEPHLGEKIDLNLQFTDEAGVTAPIGRYFQKGKPVLMAMVYYTCPGLCNYHLNGMTETMKTLKWTSGQEFEFVLVCMNSAETPDLA